MYRIAVCDSSPAFITGLSKTLQMILSELSAEFAIDGYHLPDPPDDLIRNGAGYHLLFLELTAHGVDLAMRLRGCGCCSSIIFMIDLPCDPLESCRTFPFYYLRRPIDKEELFAVIKKDFEDRFVPHHFLLNSKKGAVVLPLADLLYIETLNRCTLVYARDQMLEYAGPLKNLLVCLPPRLFVQCHKSFALNISQIDTLTRSYASLRNRVQIPVGRAFSENVMRSLAAYLYEK